MFTIHQGHLTGSIATTADWFQWIQQQETLSGVTYLVCQQEAGGNTQRDHIQGYIHFSGQKRPSTVGNLLHCKPEAFTMARGDPSSNRGYCTKTDTRKPGTEHYEYGDCPGNQGTKMKTVAEALKTKGLEATVQEYPETYLSHHSGFHKLAEFYQILELRGKRRSDPVKLIIAWGDAGCGKTYWADAYDPEHTFTFPEQSTGSGPVWFDGYQGEPTLCIQDFDSKTMNYRTLLRMCDETYHQFKIHGGYTIGKWDTILITSNTPPTDWYNHAQNPWYYDGDTVGPLQRRVTNLFEGHGRWPRNAWFEGNHPIIEMPTRSTINSPIDAEVPPATEDAAEVAADGPDPASMHIGSNAVHPSAGDIPLDELLQDFDDQDQAQANDFMAGIEIGSAPGPDPDNILLGTDGDTDPLAGHWIAQGFTHF